MQWWCLKLYPGMLSLHVILSITCNDNTPQYTKNHKFLIKIIIYTGITLYYIYIYIAYLYCTYSTIIISYLYTHEFTIAKVFSCYLSVYFYELKTKSY